ncbi:MAG: LD-carboxypeptidase, partial [bacterium]
MTLKYPKQNDIIGIIAPSRPLHKNISEVEHGIDFLIQSGFKIKRGRNLSKVFYYSAGTVRERLADLHDMFEDPSVKAIICANGGSCSNQLLEMVDFGLIKRHPKIFIGYSDITNLLLAINQKCNFPVFYGPLVRELAALTPQAKNFYLDLLLGKNIGVAYPKKMQVLRSGRAQGTLVGGYLSIICDLLHTPYLPDLENTILFWEVAGICPALIDSEMQTLRLSGVFKKIK